MTTKEKTPHLHTTHQLPAIRSREDNPTNPAKDTRLNPLSGLWVEARKRKEEKERLRREKEENLRIRKEALAAEKARFSHD
jgi:hypothetical protein